MLRSDMLVGKRVKKRVRCACSIVNDNIAVASNIFVTSCIHEREAK